LEDKIDTLFATFVSSDQKCQQIVIQEFRHCLFTKLVTRAAWRRDEKINSGGGIAPKHAIRHWITEIVDGALDSGGLAHGEPVRCEAAVDTENLLVNQRSEWHLTK
jgi:hypothetical protein